MKNTQKDLFENQVSKSVDMQPFPSNKLGDPLEKDDPLEAVNKVLFNLLQQNISVEPHII